MSFKNELKKGVKGATQFGSLRLNPGGSPCPLCVVERVYALTIQALAMLSLSVERFPSQHFYYRSGDRVVYPRL